MENLDKIQELEEKHNTRILTRDDIDFELDNWASDMIINRGYSFTELLEMVQGEEYLDNDYEYYVLDTGYLYPKVEYCCNSIEELEEYYKESNYYKEIL